MPDPKEYTLPYFETLDLTDLGDYYDTEIELNGLPVQLDLNFDDGTTTVAKLDGIKAFLSRLPQQDQRNREYMRADYDAISEEDSLKFYLNFHLEEIGEEQLIRLMGVEEDETLSIEEQLLEKISLVRVGFYPDEDGYFAICDYSFGRDITNYLVVMSLDKNGELLYMTVES